MRMGKPIVIIAMLLVLFMTVAAASGEEKAAASNAKKVEAQPAAKAAVKTKVRPSEPIVLTTKEAYLLNVTGTVQVKFKELRAVGLISRNTKETKLTSQTELRVLDGKAVIKAGELRLYLNKQDRVALVIDDKVLESEVTVPEGYPHAVTVRTGIIKEKLEASHTLTTPIDKKPKL